MVEDDAVFYSTRDIRDFGIGMKHRTMRVILMIATNGKKVKYRESASVPGVK